MRYWVVLIGMLYGFCSYAQVPEPAMLWMKTWGGNVNDNFLSQVMNTEDGGHILFIQGNSAYGTGTIDSFCGLSGSKGIFQKYNADASVLEWSKCYGFSGDSFLLYLYPQPDGGVLLGGTFRSDVSWGFLVTKHDASGNVLWQHNYSKGNGAILRSMMPTDDGGYLLLGESYVVDTNVLVHYGGAMVADLWLLKVDGNGNKVWSKTIGGTGHESGAALVAAPGNGCYVVGGTGSYDYNCTGNPGGGSVYLARLDVGGNILWHRVLGGTGMDAGISACSNGAGGVVIAAQTYSADGDVHNYKGSSDIWVVEVAVDSNIVWDNCFGGSGYELPHSICRATDGTIWVAGKSNTKSGDVDTSYTIMNYDSWFVHCSSTGNLLNAKVLGTSGLTVGYVVVPLSDGTAMGGGGFKHSDGSFENQKFFGGDEDAFLTKFAPWSTRLTAKEHNKLVNIHPNPAGNTITVSAPGLSGISITNLLGQLVLSVECSSDEVHLDIATLPAGVYAVRVTDAAGAVAIRRIVKE